MFGEPPGRLSFYGGVTMAELINGGKYKDYRGVFMAGVKILLVGAAIGLMLSGYSL